MANYLGKKKNKTNKHSISFSNQVKLAAILVLVLLIVVLIVFYNSNMYPIFNIISNVKSADINNYYDTTNVTNIDLNNINDDYIINEGGTYCFTGNGQNRIIINKTNQKVYLCLNDVTINSTDICIVSLNNKNTIINVSGTNNLISNGSYTINDKLIDACIYSSNDLIINGEGTLKVNSSNNGIKASDNLVVCNLTLDIESTDFGLNVNEGLDLYNTNVTINSVTDGIHSGNETIDNTFVTINNTNLNITTTGDAIDSTGVIGIKSGDITIKTSYKNYTYTSSQVGLKSSKGIIIKDGNISINSYDHSIKTETFEIFGGILDTTSKQDCIHVSEYLIVDGGNLTINASDDALHSDNCIYIKDGEINIENSYEGVEGINIYISGGITKIKSSDDGINVSCTPNESMGGMRETSSAGKPSNGVLKITGGILYVNAGGDGLDSNDKIVMTGGLVLVDGPTDNGNGSLDYDTTCKVTGGTLIACGSTGMAQGASSGQCGGIYTVSGSSNETFLITDSKGKLILAYTPSKTYQCFAISSNLLKKNKTYKIYLGATVLGSDKCGFITSGTIEDYGTLNQSFTAATAKSSTNGMGGFGGGGMGGFGGGGFGGR